MNSRATTFLEKNKIEFTLHLYDHKVKGADFAAKSTGIELNRMIKTLVICDVNRKNYYFALMPGDKNLNLKEVAKIYGYKKMTMAKIDDAEKITGYQVGGTSPFGSLKRLPVIMDKSLEMFDKIGINGGGRGIIVQLKLDDLIKLLNPKIENISK